MFGTSSETIQGAIEQGGAASSEVEDFNGLISISNINLFDVTYAGTVNQLSDITSSLQYQNYPQLSPSIEIASIRLVSGQSCGGSSTGSYTNTIWVDTSKLTFTLSGGHLRVDNGGAVNSIPLTVYSPGDPGTFVATNSLDQTGTANGPNGTYLIQDQSLTTTSSDVEVVIDLSGDATFQTCFL